MFKTLMTLADESVRHLQHSHARLLETVTPDAAQGSQAPHSALAPLQRLNAYQGLMGNVLARQARMVQDLWALACNPVADASLVTEMVQMQRSIFQRLATQQTDALRGLAEISARAAHIRKANTVSKLMEQEYDLFAQFNALIVAQATTLVELAENIQMNAGYLLTRKAEGEKA